jgi:hypothetical protein
VVYLFVAHAATGAVSVAEVPCRIKGEMCCWINFGDAVAAVVLDTTDDRQTSSGARLFQTAGSNWPMSFYGDNREMSGTISGTALRYPGQLSFPEASRAGISDFDALAAYSGSVVIRRPYWDAFVAAIEVSQSSMLHRDNVTISWRRVRNYGLAI